MKKLIPIAKLVAALFAVLLVYDSFLPAISTLMIGRAFTFQSLSRQWVPLSRISPNLTRAVIGAEDGKFCTHHGVDWEALHGAVSDAIDEDGKSHGASTVPMQVAKNLFLWPGRSYLRKAIEIPLALGLDGLWSKRRMMEVYLNIAEFGPGLFGAEAASRRYFHKSAAALTPREAALLAATLPNPRKRNPARPSGYVSAYADSIVGRGPDTSCLRSRH